MPGLSFGQFRAALQSVIARWLGTDPYVNRATDLTDLIRQQTADDKAPDLLTGGDGLDWYFAIPTGRLHDSLADFGVGELVTDLSGP
jgi:hypothetical protein